MTLAQLKEKYQIEKARYEPNPNCKFCKGAGERPMRAHPHADRLTFCICLYVEHKHSDEMGSMLGSVARRLREEMESGA